MTADVIHVRWRSSATLDAAAEEKLVRLLDRDECLEWQRKAIDADRKLYLLAHVLRRELIADLTGYPSEHIRFSRGAYGKPLLVSPDIGADLFFSLSHTDGLAIVAASRAGPVGIDAERRSRRIADAALKAVMSRGELDRISRKGPEEGLRLWTLKEAYSKALGLGLHLRFSDLDFSTGLSGSVDAPRGFHTWHGQEIPVGGDHIATLAYPVRRGRAVRIETREPPEIPIAPQRHELRG
ncbi:4'-phosphopantetheinyl transferase superfamily protein [Nisaea sp.]|uniref:4'-phosphopantetheinyl transferase family protein n=1 Tax=Nisaea sp. TaxID=2024842 RepID=UPI0032ED237E